MFTKIAILVAIISVVWFGFRYFERRQNIADGRRRTGERTFGERLRKSLREKENSGPDPMEIEDTEQCPVCKAYVAVEGVSNCGKPKCPY